MKLLIFSRITIAVKAVLQNKKISLMYKKHQTDFLILIFIILYKWCWVQKIFWPQLMPRIASLLCNFRNPTNTSNPAYLQANLLLVGVWRVKPPDSNLYVNIHCYLLLTLASSYKKIIKRNNWKNEKISDDKVLYIKNL